MKRLLVILVAHLCICALVLAQGPSNPRETVTAKIDGKNVSINYGRPALKGRSLDDLLGKLPADRIWRTGANQVTTLTSEADLTIGGKKVPAGKYSLYVHVPDKGDWSLVVNSDPGIELVKIFPAAPAAVANELWPRLDGYQKNIADKEVARATMKKATPASPADLFTITLNETSGGADLTMSWGNQSWSAEIRSAR